MCKKSIQSVVKDQGENGVQKVGVEELKIKQE